MNLLFRVKQNYALITDMGLKIKREKIAIRKIVNKVNKVNKDEEEDLFENLIFFFYLKNISYKNL